MDMEKYEHDLNKFEKKQEDMRISLELLVDKLDGDFVQLSNMIDKIKKQASSYDGYDFTEDIKFLIEDMI
jgi:flagellar capping protein FliD